MTKQKSNEPVAVLISDIHYNIHTLPLADAALRQAVYRANSLNVPLIVAGDLHDTKANLRGECVKALLDTISLTNRRILVIIGNHDKLNEKSIGHSLDFLRQSCALVEHPTLLPLSHKTILLLPYYSSPEELCKELKHVEKGSTIIMHQGLEGSDGGDYIQDKSAIRYEDVADFRVISGHYHKRQDIKTGRPQVGAVGLFSYIGNPYTLSYGEAKDPQKGFQVLYSDGFLKFEPTNLRKHVVVELTTKELSNSSKIMHRAGDLLKIKLSGTREELVSMPKQQVGKYLGLPDTGWVLELDPINPSVSFPSAASRNISDADLLDEMIDSLNNVSDEQKTRLKNLYRDI